MNFRKIFFVFGALGMLLSSCNKIAEVENSGESKGIPCVITATFDATRTSVDENWNTTWDENDKMTVYVTRESGSGRKYGYSQFTYKGDGKFDGTVNSDFCSPFNWFAVYPSFRSSSSTASKVEAEIEHPATQTMTGNTKAHIAGANDPAFGYVLGKKVADNPTIRMHHIASVIDFNITNGSEKAIKVTKVEFTAPGKIAGKFTADVDLWKGDVQAPEWEADDSAVNTVTLNVSDGAPIAKGEKGHFYAAIHPISADGDYTIKVTATSEGKTYVSQKTVKASLTFKAGEYKTVSFKFVPGDPEPPTKTYSKVTTAPSDWSGTYLIVKESSNYAFAYDQTGYRTSVSISSSKIVSGDLEKYEMTISLADDDQSDHYVVKTSNGKYLYRTDSDSKNFLNDTKTYNEEEYYAKIGGSKGDFTLETKYSGARNTYYFRYSSSAFSFSTSSSNTIQLFKLEDNRQAQNISFVKEAVELTLGDDYKVGQSYDVQGLSGDPKTTVTWTSSDEDVATVANDGKITIIGDGETVITATAAESAEYKKATASYTLTIIDPTKIEYYVLVEKEPESWDGTYLIVNAASGSAYAFDYTTANGAYADGKEVTITDKKIVSTKTVDACAVTVSKYGDSHAAETEHVAYDIKVDNGKYLFRYGTSTKIIQDKSQTSDGRQNQHTLVYDGAVRMMFAGNTSKANKYYFHFNSSSKFTYEDTKNAEDDSAYRVYFFKKQ